MVHIPARCNNCFNRAVADVRNNCTGCVAAVQGQIDEINSELESGCDSSRGSMLRLELSVLREEIRDFKKSRDDKIAGLRAKQGV